MMLTASTTTFSSTINTQRAQKKPSCKTDDPTARTLGYDYVPSTYDVVCARGKQSFNHPGNMYLRVLVEQAKRKYRDAKSKVERSIVVAYIVNAIRSNGIGFVKQAENTHNKGEWYEIGDYLSREKVSSLLRNANSNIYKSSAKAKQARKKDMSHKFGDEFTRVFHSNAKVSQVLDSLRQGVQQQPDLSDEEVMTMFNQANASLLSSFKDDTTLIVRFHAITCISEDDDATMTEDDDTASFEGDEDTMPMAE